RRSFFERSQKGRVDLSRSRSRENIDLTREPGSRHLRFRGHGFDKYNTAKRAAEGNSSYRSPIRFAVASTPRLVTPVTLPPGRLRLETKPPQTGSPAVEKRIGTVVVAAIAARALCACSATITFTLRLTRSAANSGKRPYSSWANRYSIARFLPST